MARIRYDMAMMRYISMFEKVTRARLKDVIDQEGLLFIVSPGEAGKAIGRGGANVKRLSNILKKEVSVAEFSPEIDQFIQNLVFPVQIDSASIEDGILRIRCPDTKTKGKIIGRDRSRLAALKEILSRHFPIDEIKVE